MNILFFTESGLGIGGLLVDQYLSLLSQNPNTYAVMSSLEQEKGLIDSIRLQTKNYLLLPGLEEHKNFKEHCSRLKEYIYQNQIDIVHVQTNWELAMMAYIKYFLMKSTSLKIVYTIHGFRNNYKYKKYLALIILNIVLLLFTDLVICSCSYLKRQFLLCRYKTVIIPFGIKDSYFLGKFNLNAESLQMIYPARFRIGKNQDILIKAFAHYVESNVNDTKSCLYLPGDGELLEDMKNLVKTLHLEERIVFPGLLSKEKLGALYDICNIAVIPSSSETFGQCIVEPYILGKCIVTRRVGVVDDIVKEGINGFVFNTEKELRDILCKLSKSKQNIYEIGYNNYKQKDRFSWKKITQLYIDTLCQKFK